MTMYNAYDWLVDCFVCGFVIGLYIAFPYLPGCSSAKWN